MAGANGAGGVGRPPAPQLQNRHLLDRALLTRGPGALQALVEIGRGVYGHPQPLLAHCASNAIDLRVRKAADLILNPGSPDRIRTFAQLIPKAALHIHLDGSANPKTVYDLAKEKRIDLRAVQPELPENYTVRDLERFMRIPKGEKVADFWNFLIKSFALPLAVMQDEHGIEKISYELMKQAYEDGVLHVEARFAPCVHLEKGLSYEQVIEAVLRGLHKGARDFRISFTATPAIYRDKTDSRFGDKYKDSARLTTVAVLRSLSRHGFREPLAFDLVGFETPYPPELFTEYFDRIHRSGIPITVHAGEPKGSERNIIAAVQVLHAQRIGHGIQVLHLPEATQQDLIRRRIPFEVCPTSNVQLDCIDGGRLEDHPIRQLIARGFNVTLNPDNITISGVTVSDEILNLHHFLGLPIFRRGSLSTEITGLMSNSVEAAFVGKLRRAQLRQEFLGYYQALNALLKLVPLAA